MAGLCDPTTIAANISSEIHANMDYITPWLMIAVLLPIIFYILSKMFKSSRWLIIYSD